MSKLAKSKKNSDNYSLSLFNSNESDIFKKPVQASQMIVQNDLMTGQQLLAWNILVKNAKDQKNYFERSNLVAKENEGIYRISRKELMERMDYKSTNRGPFKQALIDMQGLKASWDVLGSDSQNKWASCVLLPFIQCDDDFVSYSFVSHIEPMLFQSTIYSKLDLVIQKKLKLDSSRKLYDWLNRYRSNPSKLSNKNSWQFWKTVIHGKDDSSYGREYKIFKRDKLKPAIKEINEISDLIIELIEDKNGSRSVVNIQFRINEKPKFLTESEEKSLSETFIKQDLDHEFSKLNISSYLKRKIKSMFPENIILSNIQYTLDRIIKEPGKILNQGAYLKSACEGNFAKATEQNNVDNGSSNSNEKTTLIMQSIYFKRKIHAEKLYFEYSSIEQDELRAQYNQLCELDEEKIPDDINKRQARHLVPFYNWLAMQTWGEPTSQEIIEETLKSDFK